MAVLTNGWLHASGLRKYSMNIVTISKSRLCSENYLPREFSFLLKAGLKLLWQNEQTTTNLKILFVFYKFTSFFTQAVFKHSHISECNGMFVETNTAIMA